MRRARYLLGAMIACAACAFTPVVSAQAPAVPAQATGAPASTGAPSSPGASAPSSPSAPVNPRVALEGTRIPDIVNDETWRLSGEQRDLITRATGDDLANPNAPLIVVRMVASTPGVVEKGAEDTQRDWGFDHAPASNVLIYVAVDDRKMRIATSPQARTSLDDDIAQDIVNTTTRKYFARGDYAGGLDYAATSIHNELAPTDPAIAAREKPTEIDGHTVLPYFYAVIGIGFTLVIIGAIIGAIRNAHAARVKRRAKQEMEEMKASNTRLAARLASSYANTSEVERALDDLLRASRKRVEDKSAELDAAPTAPEGMIKAVDAATKALGALEKKSLADAALDQDFLAGLSVSHPLVDEAKANKAEDDRRKRAARRSGASGYESTDGDWIALSALSIASSHSSSYDGGSSFGGFDGGGGGGGFDGGGGASGGW